MRQLYGTLMTRLKEYEHSHPILIIIWSVLITMLLVLGGVKGISFFHTSISEEYVVFNNKSFEREIQRILKKDKISQADLDTLNVIDIEDNHNITDISDLSKCEKLTTLIIKNCGVSDISAIGNLSELQTLDLTGNDITDISALENCYSLIELTLTSNQITDISPLYNLDNLSNLIIQQNNIGIIKSGIEKMRSLTYLDLSKNRLTNIDELNKVEQLNYLYVASNKLSETPSLEGLDNLLLLDLGGNAFQNIGYMGNFLN